jgi:hypothetical protein
VRSLLEIEKFAEYIDREAERVLTYQDESALESIPTAICHLAVDCLTTQGKQATLPQYAFTYRTRIQAFRPLVYSRSEKSDNLIVLELRGKREQIRMYLRHLKRLEALSAVQIVDVSFTRYIGKLDEKA